MHVRIFFKKEKGEGKLYKKIIYNLNRLPKTNFTHKQTRIEEISSFVLSLYSWFILQSPYVPHKQSLKYTFLKTPPASDIESYEKCFP